MSERKCGNCGETGHNARSCTVGKEEAAPEEPKVGKELTLVRALHAAQWEARSISKDSRNSFSSYDYTSAESMMRMWTDISGRHGLALFPLELAVKYAPGDPPILCTTWILSHIRGEDRTLTMDWPIVTGKGKPMDKAIASARTSSLGYLIRDLLIAPRVHPTDDMDHDTWSQPRESSRGSSGKPPRTYQDDLRQFESALASMNISIDTMVGYLKMRGTKPYDKMTVREHTRTIEWLMSPEGRQAIKNYKSQ